MVRERANAKINLFLDVLCRRDDGFHNIKSVMHSISLSDFLTVSASWAEETLINIRSDASDLPSGKDNLVYRAAEKYLSRFNKNAVVDIYIEKHIPISAGLAGGSSDAAATLRALNRLYGGRLTDGELLLLAAELGSDVPYLVHGGTAFCFGRGELIEPLPPLSGLNIVVAIADGESVSTPAAYGAIDALYSDFKTSRAGDPRAKLALLKQGIIEGKLDTSGLYNIFENAIFPICSGAESLKRKLVELGAIAALMSGSGPSVYGLFESEASARLAESELRALGCRAFFVRSFDESQNIL